VTKKVQTN